MLIFHAIDSNIVANALNLVVLTAALSVYNSCVYCNSRMLFGLAQQGNAPRALLRVNHRGIPLTALAVSAVATALCVVINYVMPESLCPADGPGGGRPGHQLGDDLHHSS